MENVWRKFAVHARLRVDLVSKNQSSSSIESPFFVFREHEAVDFFWFYFTVYRAEVHVRVCAERFVFYFATNWK